MYGDFKAEIFHGPANMAGNLPFACPSLYQCRINRTDPDQVGQGVN
jgi:hypothetical protein